MVLQLFDKKLKKKKKRGLVRGTTVITEKTKYIALNHKGCLLALP
jgi:hypothetical protein